MKKNIFILFAAICLWAAPACNYLDVVPEDRATEEDAFKDVQALKRYLYGCYSAIPIPHHCVQSADLYTADEVIHAPTHEVFNVFLTGQYTTSEAGSSQQNIHNILTWRTIPQAIQNCYLLLENVDKVPGVTPEDVRFYTGQAHFLIAYLHYLMLRQYGPIILQEGKAPLTLPEADYPARTSYDDCVDWIANRFDQAIAEGLSNYADMQPSEYGLGHKEAAFAIKARMLLYAASPLFNGGAPSQPDGDPHVANLTTGADNMQQTWENFKNKDGQQLISSTYDAAKWERARDACKAAVEAAEAAGFQLYTAANNAVPDLKYPTDSIHRALRMTFVDRMGTKELILADARNGGDAVTAYGIQKRSAPTGSSTFGYNSCAPTLTMVETFYTKNGLPINEDNQWSGYSNPYAIMVNSAPAPSPLPSGVTSIPQPKDAHYKGGNFPWTTKENLSSTMALNLDREPRFNAWIAYHGSYYEYNTQGNTGTDRTQGLIAVGFRRYDNCGKQDKSQDYPLTGYLLKKSVHPLNTEGSASGATSQVYPWPVIRLAEVYLNYAEALVETNDLPTAVTYINKVRARAGLKGVDESWQSINKTPSGSQNMMRRIVRQERTIELYMENHRFWDIRRWLLGTKYFGAKVRGMDVMGETDAEFLKVVEVERPRMFMNAHYLMPIPISEINKNPKLVQNPGY